MKKFWKAKETKKELVEVHNRNIIINSDNGENIEGFSKVTSYDILT